MSVEAFQAITDQRILDSLPCPDCSGDRLRPDFTTTTRCHVPIQAPATCFTPACPEVDCADCPIVRSAN